MALQCSGFEEVSRAFKEYSEEFQGITRALQGLSKWFQGSSFQEFSLKVATAQVSHGLVRYVVVLPGPRAH